MLAGAPRMGAIGSTLQVLAFMMIAGIILGFVLPTEASCICQPDLDPAPLALVRYDAVFVGRAVAVRLGNPDASLDFNTEFLTDFAVRKVYKGELGKLTTVTSAPSMCGFQFELGRVYLVWANRKDRLSALNTSACSKSSVEGQPGFDWDIRL